MTTKARSEAKWAEKNATARAIRGDGSLAKSMAAHDATNRANMASVTASEHGGSINHKMAGEAHLQAAAAHAASGGREGPRHLREAAAHAALAGGAWDESKHPRDENGKFT